MKELTKGTPQQIKRIISETKTKTINNPKERLAERFQSFNLKNRGNNGIIEYVSKIPTTRRQSRYLSYIKS